MHSLQFQSNPFTQYSRNDQDETEKQRDSNERQHRTEDRHKDNKPSSSRDNRSSDRRSSSTGSSTPSTTSRIKYPELAIQPVPVPSSSLFSHPSQPGQYNVLSSTPRPIYSTGLSNGYIHADSDDITFVDSLIDDTKIAGLTSLFVAFLLTAQMPSYVQKKSTIGTSPSNTVDIRRLAKVSLVTGACVLAASQLYRRVKKKKLYYS
jgi:hypothetical protein